MLKDTEVFDELNEIMTGALFHMQSLISSGATQQDDFVSMAKIFLLGLISTAADLAEAATLGASTYLYAEIEAAVKQGGLRAVRDIQIKNGSAGYSVSNIDPGDEDLAMNYLGQEMGVALFKHIHDLPTQLRKPEMLLRGVEALLGNLLHQKFSETTDPHQVLDSFCEHVHMALNDLKSRQTIQ
jgi:hypothetical protein